MNGIYKKRKKGRTIKRGGEQDTKEKEKKSGREEGTYFLISLHYNTPRGTVKSN